MEPDLYPPVFAEPPHPIAADSLPHGGGPAAWRGRRGLGGVVKAAVALALCAAATLAQFARRCESQVNEPGDPKHVPLGELLADAAEARDPSPELELAVEVNRVAEMRSVVADLRPDAGRAAALKRCACGCGIFSVGNHSMLPKGEGGSAWIEVDYQDQTRNWRGSSRAPAADNDDKHIRTIFLTAGLQYMFDRDWGVEVELPYAFRGFEAAREPPAVGNATADWDDVGDIRVRGLYTGLTDDMSLGVSFGLKLPTGGFRHDGGDVDVDRDTQIGSGSTDILLGAFYWHAFPDGIPLGWFAQASADVPVLIQDDYRPGVEFDQALGLYYKDATCSTEGVDIVPVVQVITVERTRDTGANSAHPVASGYERVLLSAGIEFDFHPITVHADVELPVFQHTTGDQVVSPVLLKLIASVSF